MVVRIRCVHCGQRFRETESVLGRTIPCPACGQWLKVEAGLTLSGEATFARVSAAEVPKAPPKKAERKKEEEPSFWRNPAPYIGLAAIAAIVIAFVIVLGHESEPLTTTPTPGKTTESAAGPAEDASPQTASAGQPPEAPGPRVGEPSEVPEKPEPAPSEASSGPSGQATPPGPAATGQAPGPAEPGDTEPSPSETTPAPSPDSGDTTAPAGLSAQDIFKRSSPAVVQVVVRDQDLNAIGQGSGFLVSSDGLVVTNHHVVSKAAFATVVLPSRATLFVQGVLAFDADADLAILKVNGADLPYVRLASKEKFPEVGARVYAIGSPKGLSNTLSEGLVSGLRQESQDLRLIQTTAAISPGSSGGPLLNAEGHVVGVTTMILVGEGAQNLNFAVPAANIYRLLERARGAQPQPLASAGGRPLGTQASKELQEAWDAIEDERWGDAVETIQRLRQREPDNPQVYFVLGLLHVRLGNYDLALETFTQQVRLAPDEGAGYFGQGIAYHNLSRYAEAVTSFRKGIRLTPNFWSGHLYLGMSLYELGRYRECVDACKEAIRLRPDASFAYYHLGLAYIAMRDRQQALQAYRTLLQLDPPLAARLRSELYEP